MSNIKFWSFAVFNGPFLNLKFPDSCTDNTRCCQSYSELMFLFATIFFPPYQRNSKAFDLTSSNAILTDHLSLLHDINHAYYVQHLILTFCWFKSLTLNFSDNTKCCQTYSDCRVSFQLQQKTKISIFPSYQKHSRAFDLTS